jgi:hypothetical protein
MSSRTSRGRLPLSMPNLVIVIVGAVGAVATALTGNVPGAVYLGLIAVFILVVALIVHRRRDARDITRINALEYVDERDRRLAASGFAVVGAVALALSSLEFVVATFAMRLFPFPSFTGVLIVWIAGAQSIVLCVVWAVANSRAVRRG